jgi:hypothetical protein
VFFLGSFAADEGLDVGASFSDQATGSDLSPMAWADAAVAGLAVVALPIAERDRGPCWAGCPSWRLVLAATARSGADRRPESVTSRV